MDSVMAGHSRSKNGVAPLAYVPAIPLRQAPYVPCRDARDKPGHDEVCGSTTESRSSFVSHRCSPCRSPVCRLYHQGICLLGACQALFFLRCFACYFAARGAFTGMAPLFMPSHVLDAALRCLVALS